MTAPDGLPPLREVIAAHGLSARKALGQNFLLDLNLTAKIARRAGDLTTCDVLEIGPGPGGLTRALLAAGARHVVAIERDDRCLPALAEIAAAWPGRLTVLPGDALALDPRPQLTPPVRIVANLPYNVGTELLVRWLSPPDWPPFWTSLTLMFQKEVAERIVAAARLQGLRPPVDPGPMAQRRPHRLRDPAPGLHPAAQGDERGGADRPAGGAALSRRPGDARSAWWRWPSASAARCSAPASARSGPTRRTCSPRPASRRPSAPSRCRSRPSAASAAWSRPGPDAYSACDTASGAVPVSAFCRRRGRERFAGAPSWPGSAVAG